MSNKISIDALKTRVHVESGFNPAFKNVIGISLEKEYVFKDEWYDIISISLSTAILSDSDLQEIKALMSSYGYYNYVIKKTYIKETAFPRMSSYGYYDYVIKVFESKTGAVQLEIQFISGLFPDFVDDETDFVKGDNQ